MNSNVALSIVVPIYNEEESLPFLVNQLLEVLQPMEETFELVLVNDGSSEFNVQSSDEGIKFTLSFVQNSEKDSQKWDERLHNTQNLSTPVAQSPSDEDWHPVCRRRHSVRRHHN